MACYISLALGALLLISCAHRGSATDYTVGGSSGWTLGYDYTTWANGKTFKVGDSLVFNFASGAHTVNEVSQSDYNSCSSSNSISSDTNGPSTVQLKTAGTHYFLCAISGHCSGGMKIAVPVQGASSSPTTPSTPSTTPSITPPSSTSPPAPRSSAAAPGLSPAPATLLLGAGILLLSKLALSSS